MKVRIGRPAGGGAVLTVDRNLTLLHVEIADGETVGTSEDYWRARWKPIIQNGEYVDR